MSNLQEVGVYDQTTLATYDEALRDGALVVHVPAMPPESRRVADILHRHGVENVGYFGVGTFEQIRIVNAQPAHPRTLPHRSPD